MDSINSFEPVIDEQSKIIILGTMPGVQSLEKQQYYANPRNQFWKIIFSLLEESISISYADKKLFLLQNGIALWDVIDNCHRVGSLDSDIKNEMANDFKNLFKNYSNIKTVFFNGQKAFKIFKKEIGLDFVDKKFITLPSTSPAYTIAFDKKIESWKEILNEL